MLEDYEAVYELDFPAVVSQVPLCLHAVSVIPPQVAGTLWIMTFTLVCNNDQ